MGAISLFVSFLVQILLLFSQQRNINLKIGAKSNSEIFIFYKLFLRGSGLVSS